MPQRSRRGHDRVFYDVSKAEAQGFFGANPTSWGEPEYAMLIEMLTTALCADTGQWETWRYHHTMWSVNGIDTRKIEPAQKAALKALEHIQDNPRIWPSVR